MITSSKEKIDFAVAVACDSYLFHFNTLDHLLQISAFILFSFQNALFQLSDPFQSEQLESCWKGKREKRGKRGEKTTRFSRSSSGGLSSKEDKEERYRNRRHGQWSAVVNVPTRLYGQQLVNDGTSQSCNTALWPLSRLNAQLQGPRWTQLLRNVTSEGVLPSSATHLTCFHRITAFYCCCSHSSTNFWNFLMGPGVFKPVSVMDLTDQSSLNCVQCF